MVNPDISVVITAFNRKEFLDRAINSAINQSFPGVRYEIIIVTNFSPSIDPTMLLKFKGNIKFVGFTSEPISEMLRRGIHNASGDIISFLDDDDLFTEGKLQRVYEAFLNHPDMVYYHNNYLRFRELGKYEKGLFWTSQSIYISKNKMEAGNIRKLIRQGGNFNLSCISVKKSHLGIILDESLNFNYLPDSILFYSMLAEGDFQVDSSVLTHYYSHKSVSNQGTDCVVQKTIDAIQQIYDRIQRPGHKFLRSDFQMNVIMHDIIYQEPRKIVLLDFFRSTLSLLTYNFDRRFLLLLLSLLYIILPGTAFNILKSINY